MISTFRPKTQTTQGVDVQRPAEQAPEIASMIGATSFSVDLLSNSATFNLPGDHLTVTVTGQQVISISAGEISVHDRNEFFEKFEADVIV